MSSTNTSEDKAEEAALIAVTAFHRRDKDLQVISFRPAEHNRIKSCIAAYPSNTSSQPLGLMGCLPIELVHKICFELDIESLLKLRQVNSWTRQMVTGISQYQAVTKHALDALLAVFRLGVAKQFTLPDIYRPLIKTFCEKCGKYGGYVFIPTLTRACLDCVSTHGTFPLITVNSAIIRVKGVGQFFSGDIPWVPVIQTLPGWYCLLEKSLQNRTKIASWEALLEEMKARRGPNSLLVRDMTTLWNSSGFVTRQDYTHANVASVGVPTFDPDTVTAYWGLSCRGCAMEMDNFVRMRPVRMRPIHTIPEHIDKVYSRDEFLEHVKTCEHAQALWEASENGTKDVSDLESGFSLNGGFNPERMVPKGDIPW